MSKVILYGSLRSPPVRACLLTLKALEISYEFKVVNMAKLEHLSEELVKHNPQHTVPVLEDNGVWLWDSHAICAYLVSKYGKTDSLYPKDLIQRAIIDQRMYFDASMLFMALRSVSFALFRKNITVVTKEKTDLIIEGYEFMEKFLGDNPYITGNEMNIADFCCGATVSSLRGIVEIEIAKFPRIHAWLERLRQLPYYEEANGRGAEEYIALLKSKITEIIM